MVLVSCSIYLVNIWWPTGTHNRSIYPVFQFYFLYNYGSLLVLLLIISIPKPGFPMIPFFGVEPVLISVPSVEVILCFYFLLMYSSYGASTVALKKKFPYRRCNMHALRYLPYYVINYLRIDCYASIMHVA